MTEQTKHVTMAVANYSEEVFVQEDSDHDNEEDVELLGNNFLDA